MNYTYLLRCADGSLYCGWTNHLKERVEAHNAGKGAKYTKGRGPVNLVWSQSFATKEEAMSREFAVKRLTRAQKEELISCFTPLLIIISPAKRMQARPDDLPWRGMPEYLQEAGYLLSLLKSLDERALKELFKANDSITHENYLRFRDMDLHNNLTASALSYVGIQYQYMAPRIFSGEQWDYVCRHLRILSAFYGVLRACDGIVPYRLEMQAALKTEKSDNLYGFWGDKIYRAMAGSEKSEGCRILNLASREYSKAVEPYLEPKDQFVTCVFGTEMDGRVKVKATEAKMARGEMVRFLAETGAEEFEQVKKFDRLNYTFCPEHSNAAEYVFIKGKDYDRTVE